MQRLTDKPKALHEQLPVYLKEETCPKCGTKGQLLVTEHPSFMAPKPHFCVNCKACHNIILGSTLECALAKLRTLGNHQ